MSASLWWIPAGIAAWFVLAVAVALVLGPLLAGNDATPQPPGDEEEGPS